MKRKIFSCLQSVPIGNRLVESFELAAYQKKQLKRKQNYNYNRDFSYRRFLRCERLIFLGGFVLAILLVKCTFAGDEGLVAWWKFDEGEGKTALDSVSGVEDEIRGNFKFVNGSINRALKFDGFTTSVVRKAAKAPKLGDAFTIEAWVALGAYPWNWCPIVSREKEEKAGYYFGIDSQGRLGLRRRSRRRVA